MATTRAKFRCNSIEDFGSSKRAKLTAVCRDATMENTSFATHTPSGEITMLINNPAAAVVFKPGAEYYVDFTAVDPAAEA